MIRTRKQNGSDGRASRKHFELVFVSLKSNHVVIEKSALTKYSRVDSRGVRKSDSYVYAAKAYYREMYLMVVNRYRSIIDSIDFVGRAGFHLNI